MLYADTDATDIASLMLLICWTLLQTPSWINPRFIHVLSTQAILSALFEQAGISFCPGLSDIIRAATSPPLSWIEDLSDYIPKNVWGVYVLVLRHPSRTPYLYIGAATAYVRGARARISEHGRGILSPQHVATALDSGYTISHRALLCHCPIPVPAEVPRLRTLIIVLEAALTGVFWTLHRHNKSYGLGDICPWPRDTFQWSGLCSHNPLIEGIRSNEHDLDFTAEQLQQMAAQIKEKNRLYQVSYQKILRVEATPEYKARQNRNNKKQAPRTRARQQAAVVEEKYFCPVCKVACRDAASLRQHETTPRHARKTRMGDDDHRCGPCDISFRFLSALKAHERSKGHIKKTSH